MATEEVAISAGKMAEDNTDHHEYDAIAAEEDEKPVREKLRDAAISSQRGSQTPESSDAEMGQHTPPEEDSPTQNKHEAANGPTKAARKRSLEDLKEPETGISSLDAPATPSSGTHARKKSKDQPESVVREGTQRKSEPSVPEEIEAPDTPKPGSDPAVYNSAMSPRRKRSADDLETSDTRLPKVAATEEEQKKRKSLDEDRPTLTPTENASNAASEAPAKPVTAPNSKISSFGNGPSASPFASFGAAKSPPAQSLGGASPFGALGASASTASNVATAKSSAPTNMTFATAKSPFAAASSVPAASPFGSASGSFGAGKLSSFASAKGDFPIAPTMNSKSTIGASAFGSSFKSAGKSPFASPNGGDFGSSAKSSKPFGAPAVDSNKDDEAEDDDNDDDDDGEDDDNDDNDGSEEKEAEEEKSGQYQKVEVLTGEEDEETVFSTRAKVYMYEHGFEGASAGWKERGTGVIKLNKRTTPSDPPPAKSCDEVAQEDLEAGTATTDEAPQARPTAQARLLMRNMATFKNVLNAALWKGMPIGDPQNLKEAPMGKTMMFLAQEGTDMRKFLVKIGREDDLSTLYHAIQDHLDTLE